jgi:hypothetical protein
MEEIRNTLQGKFGEPQRQFPKEGRGGDVLPTLNSSAQASQSAQSDDAGERSRSVDIREDLRQLQRALRDIIPAGPDHIIPAHIFPAGSDANSHATSSSISTPSSSSFSGTRSSRQKSSGKDDARAPKTARRRADHHHLLVDVPECGEPEKKSHATGNSKFNVCSNSLRDELAFLDTEFVSAPSSNTGFRRRLDPLPFAQRHHHRLFTS